MASKIDKIKNDFIEAVNASQKKTSAYDTEAEVVRVDGNTAWVHIAGGVTETPVALTINAQKGDKVQVRVSNEGAWLMGNATAPPTDDTKANEADKKAAEAKYIAVDAVDAALKADTAAQDAVNSADIARGAAQDAQTAASNAQTAAGNAVTAAGNALTAAQNAQVSADAALVSLSNVEDVVGVLDWITAHGTMTANGSTALDPSKVYFLRDNNGDYHVGSYYYSIVAEPKAEDRTNYYTLSINESVQNYVATHVVVDTEGLWLIPDSGGNKVLIATGAGSSYTTAGTYIIGKVNGVDTVFAKFTTDGATMNATNSTQIAHLGYGVGTAQSGTATAPYYTLGLRLNNSTVGNYSVAEGKNTTASGYCSHAEGGPSGSPNDGPVASGESSHAEGSGTLSSGKMAHAEGRYTEANGLASHAQNDGTIANGESQTVLGKYNVADTTSAVIIGNGISSTRSNALTIDWNGNVNIPAGANYCIDNVPIGGGGGTSNYNDLSNKPQINGVTLSGNKTSSNLSIHEVPSGGTTGQVLSKASGTDYDLEWSNGSGVADVKVNGTSVVVGGVADVPVAKSDRYGVVKVLYDNDPPGGVVGITLFTSSNNEITAYAPLAPYVNGNYQPIRAKFLPNATQSVKGAMSASDKTKLDGIASGAEVNVNADWNAASGDSQILNKPTLGTAAAKDTVSSISSDSNNVPTVTAVKNYVASSVTGTVAFQGTAPTTFAPTNYKAGYYWVVGTAGTYCGETCEAGDMIFATQDGTSYSAADFDVIQTNLDITSITNAEIDAIVAA